MNSNTVVLVDFSGLCWTCWEPARSAQEAGEKLLAEHVSKCASCAIEDECPNRPKQYNAKSVLLENIDLKFQTLQDAIGTPVKTWVMCLEGKEERRRQIFPGYKANREKKPFDPRPMAEEYIRGKGCKLARCPDAEADDVLATMALDLKVANIPVVIVSSDKDMWFLYDPPLIRIYLTVKKEFLTREYMEERLRVDDPKHVHLVKAVFGDPSDNVPSTAPRMQKYLIPLIKSSDGSLQDFIERAKEADISPRCRELLFGNLQQLKINWDILGLRTDCNVEWY